MKAFVIDVGKCSGCYACQLVCKDEHCGNDWSPYARPQPETGHFWGRLNEYERGRAPQVKVSYIFVPCQHCRNAPCMAACPVEDTIYRRDDGLVIIDPKKCDGCKNCVDACPYRAIFFNDEFNIAQKCTGCAHLLDRGWQEPRCVDACAHGAIRFGDEADLADLIAQGGALHPEFDTAPGVRYIGLPKKFIAGTVYDPRAEEVIIGARCTLTGDGGPFVTTTDEFGDFRFDGLASGTFTLRIESGGKTLTMNDISTEKDVGLGDIPLA
jgi:tetrathionate reductase subunit B